MRVLQVLAHLQLVSTESPAAAGARQVCQGLWYPRLAVLGGACTRSLLADIVESPATQARASRQGFLCHRSARLGACWLCRPGTAPSRNMSPE